MLIDRHMASVAACNVAELTLNACCFIDLATDRAARETVMINNVGQRLPDDLIHRCKFHLIQVM